MTSIHTSLLIDLIRQPQRAEALTLRDWDNTLRLARRSNLISRLAEELDACQIRKHLPVEVQPHLDAALTLSSHQRQAILWEVKHIAAALQPLGIQVVLLKGAAYVQADLKAARGRLFGDVDILVPHSRLNEVEAALMLRGWSARFVDPYDDKYYRKWMHELPPMVNVKRGTTIDVHHNILPSTAKDQPVATHLFSSAKPLDGTLFDVLAPCDMVIHSATHLFHEGELNNGLRDLFDLEGLLIEFSKDNESFWQELIARAKELGLVWPVRFAFRYLERVLGTDIPASIIAKLPNEPLSDLIRDRLYLSGFLPDHPLCNTLGTAAARSMLYLRGHYLRMPPAMLFRHLGRKAFLRMFKHTSR